MRALGVGPIAHTTPLIYASGGNAIRAFWHVARRIDIGDPIRVINNSWFIPGSNYSFGDTTDYVNNSIHRAHLVYYRMVDAINACMDRGCVVVGASGNGNAYMQPGLPCSYDRVLCTAAVDGISRRWIHEGVGAGWGPLVDVCGYGGIENNWDGSHFYEFNYPLSLPMILDSRDWVPDNCWRWCGQTAQTDTSRLAGWSDMRTSGATAQATGVCALIAAAYPDLSADQVIAMVKRGAVNVDADNNTSCGGSSCAGLLGAGRLDAYRALTLWGHVERDTLLSGDVYISGDVTIDAGVTVTVAAGTQVHIAPDDITDSNGKTALVVEGVLNVEGTGGSPAVFSGWSIGRGFDDWEGIYVGVGGSADFAYTRIRNAENGVYAEGTVVLSNAEIDSCGNGVYVAAIDCTLGPNVEITTIQTIGLSVINCGVAVDGLRYCEKISDT